MDDRAIFLLREINYWGKERYYSQFVNYLKNLNVNFENFTFYILNVSNFSGDGENLFFINNLVPYLKENAIPYEMINFNPIDGELIPPAVHLYLQMDKGGKREFLGMSDGEIVSFIKINTKGFSMAYMKEILISSFIFAKDAGRIEPSLEDVKKSITILKWQLKNVDRLYNDESKLGFLAGDENEMKM